MSVTLASQIVLVPGGCQPIAYPVGFQVPLELEAWPHDVRGKSVLQDAFFDDLSQPILGWGPLP